MNDAGIGTSCCASVFKLLYCRTCVKGLTNELVGLHSRAHAFSLACKQAAAQAETEKLKEEVRKLTKQQDEMGRKRLIEIIKQKERERELEQQSAAAAAAAARVLVCCVLCAVCFHEEHLVHSLGHSLSHTHDLRDLVDSV